jgi:hypothetical protein
MRVFVLSVGSPRGHSGTSLAATMAHQRPSKGRSAHRCVARSADAGAAGAISMRAPRIVRSAVTFILILVTLAG